MRPPRQKKRPLPCQACQHRPEAKPLLRMGYGGPLVVADKAHELFNMGFYDAQPAVPAPANPADAAVIIPWGTTMDKIAIHVSSQPSSRDCAE